MVTESRSSSSVRALTEKVRYHTTVILLKQSHSHSLFQTEKKAKQMVAIYDVWDLSILVVA